jgi:hypothetical protein
MRFLQLLPEIRLVRSLDTARDHDADENSEEDERAFDWCPAAVLLIFYGEGFEKEIEETVDEGVVQGQAEDDGLGEKHY